MSHSFFDDDDNTSLPTEYQPLPEAEDKTAEPDPTAEDMPDDGADFYALPTEHRSFIWSLVAALLSLLSVLLCSIYVLGMTLAVASIVCASISARRLGFFDKMALFALIVGIFGAVFGVFAMVIDITGVLDGLTPTV